MKSFIFIALLFPLWVKPADNFEYICLETLELKYVGLIFDIETFNATIDHIITPPSQSSSNDDNSSRTSPLLLSTSVAGNTITSTLGNTEVLPMITLDGINQLIKQNNDAKAPKTNAPEITYIGPDGKPVKVQLQTPIGNDSNTKSISQVNTSTPNPQVTVKVDNAINQEELIKKFADMLAEKNKIDSIIATPQTNTRSTGTQSDVAKEDKVDDNEEDSEPEKEVKPKPTLTQALAKRGINMYDLGNIIKKNKRRRSSYRALEAVNEEVKATRTARIDMDTLNNNTVNTSTNSDSKDNRKLLTMTDSPIIKNIFAQFELTQNLKFFNENYVQIYGDISRIDKSFEKIVRIYQLNISKLTLMKNEKLERLIDNAGHLHTLTSKAASIKRLLPKIKMDEKKKILVKDKCTTIEKEANKIVTLLLQKKKKTLSRSIKVGLRKIRKIIDEFLELKQEFIQESKTALNQVDVKVTYENYKCFLNASRLNQASTADIEATIVYKFKGAGNVKDIELKIEDNEFAAREGDIYNLRKSYYVKRPRTPAEEKSTKLCRPLKFFSRLSIESTKVSCEGENGGKIKLDITFGVNGASLVI